MQLDLEYESTWHQSLCSNHSTMLLCSHHNINNIINNHIINSSHINTKTFPIERQCLLTFCLNYIFLQSEFSHWPRTKDTGRNNPMKLYYHRDPTLSSHYSVCWSSFRRSFSLCTGSYSSHLGHVAVPSSK